MMNCSRFDHGPRVVTRGQNLQVRGFCRNMPDGAEGLNMLMGPIPCVGFFLEEGPACTMHFK